MGRALKPHAVTRDRDSDPHAVMLSQRDILVRLGRDLPDTSSLDMVLMQLTPEEISALILYLQDLGDILSGSRDDRLPDTAPLSEHLSHAEFQDFSVSVLRGVIAGGGFGMLCATLSSGLRSEILDAVREFQAHALYLRDQERLP